MFFFNSHGNTFKEVKCGPFPNVHVGNLGKFGASRRVKLFLKIELRQLSIGTFSRQNTAAKTYKKVKCWMRIKAFFDRFRAYSSNSRIRISDLTSVFFRTEFSDLSSVLNRNKMTGYPAFSDRISRKLVAEFSWVKSNINWHFIIIWTVNLWF
jgi:hypothetical protein